MAKPAPAKVRQWLITMKSWKMLFVEAESRETAWEEAEDHCGSSAEFMGIMEIEFHGVWEVEADRWQEELVEILRNTRPAYVYQVEEDILAELPAHFFSERYDAAAGSGNAAFIVADHELTETEKEMLGRKLLAESI